MEQQPDPGALQEQQQAQQAQEGQAQEGQGQQQQAQQPTSLRLLRLKEYFRRMVTLGPDAVDEQTFCSLIAGAQLDPRIVKVIWTLYQQKVLPMFQTYAVAEFDELAAEADLPGQLADLEALVLQRGLALNAQGAEDPTAAPAAAEAGARMAAKRAELAQLQQLLDKLNGEKASLAASLAAKQAAAERARAGYDAVAAEVDQVCRASRPWLGAAAGGGDDA